ncbi:lactate utilization protein [Heliobacillus mobilis]|uniref:Lactate utilization protein n=1 Tax=Heliobacterium mobile TaxID=28064 RepID=A0A6I3SML0_HELMO|nr:lactate utilization protein [Heliobacterium mobile]MTV50214.1 lactate utilization protein [Heliobacterium mobile]
MNDFLAWHHETLGTKVVEALTKNNFQATYCKTRQEAVEQILSLIPTDASVGVGGSQTIQELGLLDQLSERGNELLNHNRPGITPEEAMDIRRRQLVSDVFLTGTNAVTLDGQLVNRDGIGNRVAAMIFGPKKVIVVTGVNKIVKDPSEAEARIKRFAAPLNNKRINLPNPCTTTGECMNCQGPRRICNITTVLSKKPMLTEFHVIVVGEELGY